MQSDANLRKKSCLTREIINKMNEYKNLSPPFRSASRRVTLATSGTQEGEGQGWSLYFFFDDY